MEYTYKGHSVRIEAKQITPAAAQLALWICDERITPVANSSFAAQGAKSVEEATAYAQAAAKQLIDKRIADYAPGAGMTVAALEEVLDCVEQRHSYKYAADTLRTQYNTPLTTERWSEIRKWVKQ